ncbi:MAG: monomethylamine:corrinoid methyltransferase [Planctomycetota bacterium]
MIDLLQICNRAQQGRMVSEESFDLDCLYATLTHLVRKYDIKYDPDNPVPSDDGLADKIFDAAVDFFTECGVYIRSTKTVVYFTRAEVAEAIVTYNGDCHFGEGKEARIFRSRKPDSSSRPWCHVGSGIVASSEEIASRIVQGNASIKAADSMSVNALDKIDGYSITTGQPTEILGAIRSIKIARDACRQAGRPGLPIINGIATAGSALATIAAAGEEFDFRPSDGIIVGTFAEFKTNWEMMAKVTYCLSSGTNIVLASAPMLGGYGGGPEAVAILNAAYVLFGMLVYQCNYYLSLPLHLNLSCSTTRNVIWATALSSQAISRNTNMPTLTLAYAAGGPMTKSFFYESAAFIATSIASGVSTQTPHPAKAVLADYVTPLEMKTTTEIALACTGMTRKEANKVVNTLLPEYEQGLATACTGKSYTECFDLTTGCPTDEYLDFVEKIRKQLTKVGIPLLKSE